MSADELAEVRSAVAVCRKYLGCGDGSCIFVSPKGMTTNGGCQCSTKKMGMAALSNLFKVAAALVDGKDGAR